MKTTIVVAESRRALTYEMQQTMDRFHDIATLQRSQSTIIIKASPQAKDEEWMYRYMTIDEVLEGKSRGLQFADFYFVGGVPVNIRKEGAAREMLKAGRRP
jgi:hypothetical protein